MVRHGMATGQRTPMSSRASRMRRGRSTIAAGGREFAGHGDSMTLAWYAGALLGGIAASATFGDGAWPLVAALAAGAAAHAVARRGGMAAVHALALPPLLAGGIALEGRAHAAPPADDVAWFNDGPAMRVRGVVRDDPDLRDTSQQVAVSVRAVQVGGAWARASGGVLVRLPSLPRHRAGDVLELEGDLETPPSLDGFDYASYLERRGIRSVMQFPEARTIGREDLPPWRDAVLRVRRDLSRGLALALPEPQASLAQGVLLGQRSALAPETVDALNTSNTSHLVVVSGSNVVLVSTYTTMALAWIAGRRRAMLLSIAAVLGYATLVGFSPPVARAVVMGILLVIASASGRRTSGITSILAAAAVMAALDPRIVRDVSFQLSFAATAGIVYFAAPLRQWLISAAAWLLRRDEVPRPLGLFVADPASVTLAAVVATAPLMALHFGRLSLVALPANMLIVPAFTAVLGASLLAAVGGLLPGMHVLAGAPAYALLSYWLAVARWFAELPAASATIAGYSTAWAIASYATIGAIAVALLPRGMRAPSAHLGQSRPVAWRRVARVGMYAAPVAAVAFSVGFVAWPARPTRLEVTVLDVGQGDAILIETPSGANVLVDGGPGRAVLRGLGGELAWHDRRIDVLAMTHPQADHATGLIDVMARYDVRRVIAADGDGGGVVSSAFHDAVASERRPIDEVAAGDAIDLGDGVTIDVLWPPRNVEPTANPNDRALVLRLRWRDVAFLLASDIEAAAERQLLASGVDLRAGVLKVAHHGSATSSGGAFLSAVAPALSIVSTGAGNRYGHPAEDVVQRLAAYGDIIVTAKAGSVHVETDGARLWVE